MCSVAGTNGGIVVPFLESAGNPIPTGDDGLLALSFTAENVDPVLIKEIRQNAAQFYVNVHSTTFPAGEMRGQLSK